METNWNQLIELYLQNELSEEGRSAFEQELSINPELREELEMHQLIRSAAKRASQRNIIKQTGQAYLRNLRIKQFTAGIVVTAIAVTGIIYWTQQKNETNNQQSESSALKAVENSEELVCRAYQINQQTNQTGGKSSLIQPTDWQTAEGNDQTSKINTHFVLAQTGEEDHATGSRTDAFVKTQSSAPQQDSAPLHKPTVAVLGYTTDKFGAKVLENQAGAKVTKNVAWMQKYDSIGKFNDLYCGYALVMDKSKFGFVDPEGKVFIPLIYDQLVVTTNIKTSKQKNKRQNKKVLYIPKRSGKDVKDCDEGLKQPVKIMIEDEVIERNPTFENRMK